LGRRALLFVAGPDVVAFSYHLESASLELVFPATLDIPVHLANNIFKRTADSRITKRELQQLMTMYSAQPSQKSE
jgi:hypothetical protein